MHSCATRALCHSSGAVSILHLRLFQHQDNPVYDRGAYNKGDLLAELTPIPNDQGHLLFIIQGDSGKLNPDKNISEGLRIVTPLQLTGILPQCWLSSLMEPTSRPHCLTNEGVTIFIWAPLSMRAVTS